MHEALLRICNSTMISLMIIQKIINVTFQKIIASAKYTYSGKCFSAAQCNTMGYEANHIRVTNTQ